MPGRRREAEDSSSTQRSGDLRVPEATPVYNNYCDSVCTVYLWMWRHSTQVPLSNILLLKALLGFVWRGAQPRLRPVALAAEELTAEPAETAEKEKSWGLSC